MVSLIWTGMFIYYGLTGLFRTIPMIAADEIGYLGNAIYLSGTGFLPNMSDATFYHFGYSLIIAPVFWLMETPTTAYKAIIWVNAALMTSMCIGIYLILKRHLLVDSNRAAIIAALVGLYPPFMIYTKFAWSENMFIPLFVYVVYVLGLLVDKRSSFMAILFGLTGSSLYMVHPKAALIPPLVILFLVMLALTQTLSVRACLLGSVAAAAVCVVTSLLSHHLLQVGWTHSGHDAPGMAHRVLQAEGLPAYIKAVIRQVWYLNTATLGLAFLGLVYAGCLVFRKRDGAWLSLRNKSLPLVFFLVLASGAVLAASGAQMMYPARGDHAIYGRYNEGFIALWIALGIACLGDSSDRNPPKLKPGILCSFLMLVLALLFWKAGGVLPTEIVSVNVAGLAPVLGLIRRASRWDLIPVLGIVAAFAPLLLLRASSRSFSLAVVSVALWFGLLSIHGERSVLSAEMEMRQRTWMVAEIRKIPDRKVLAYDYPNLTDTLYFIYQFLLPDVKFIPFDSNHAPPPEGAVLVLADEQWKPADHEEGIPLLHGGKELGTLWYLGDDPTVESPEDGKSAWLPMAPYIRHRRAASHLMCNPDTLSMQAFWSDVEINGIPNTEPVLLLHLYTKPQGSHL